MILPTPERPSEELQELHRLRGHGEYASWCEFCVRGQARDDPHRRQTLEEKTAAKPRLEFDFAFLSCEVDVVEKHEDAEVALLAGIDCSSGCGLLLCLPNKAITEYVIQSAVCFVDELGLQEVVVASDNEPVCNKLLVKIRDRRVKPTLVRFAPRYSPQSKGTVEGYIGFVRENPNDDAGAGGAARAAGNASASDLRVVGEACGVLPDAVPRESQRENALRGRF